MVYFYRGMQTAIEIDNYSPVPANVRQMALIFYSYKRPDISLVRMHQIKPFSEISFKTLEYWCKIDGWVQKREQAKEAIAEKVKERLVDELAERELDRLKDMESVAKKMFDTIKYGNLPFRSYEGAVTAFIKLSEAITKLTEGVLHGLNGNGSQNPTAPHVQLQLSTEEKELVAKHLVKAKKRNSPEPRS